MFWFAALIALIPALAAAYFVSWVRDILYNYAAARTIGIPIRVIPFNPFNPFWCLVDRKFALLLCRFPFLGENTISRYNWRGWDIKDRWRSHYEMGDIFILVTPQYNMIQLNNPEATTNVFKRSTDFPRSVWVNDVLGVFGPNISCAEGQSWKIQRRVATRCFNEANNEIVWSETLVLSDDMLRYWSSKTSIKSSADDIRTLRLNVLARAGFGMSFKFRGHEEETSNDEVRSMGYRESLGIILENCIVILALGPKTLAFLARYWLPSKLKTVNEAVVSLQTHMTNMYEEQKHAFAAGEKNSDNNLVALLVRASQEAANEQSGGLSESEIYGNMFTFNFAGHDTTAHSSTFALHFLAANIEVQNWILRRDPTLNLPPKTIILPSYCSMHTDPKYWGSDSLEWRPSRWIRPSPNVGNIPGEEEIDMNQRGVFLGWSEGTRDCPGKKFSQVEFVALMVGLFGQWRGRPSQKTPRREHGGSASPGTESHQGRHRLGLVASDAASGAGTFGMEKGMSEMGGENGS
ncbi:cytochrome P450 [Seiridium cupressi]